MLDLNLFRAEKGGNPDLVRESQRRRYQDVASVDNIIKLGADRRAVDGKIAGLQGDYNALNKQVAELKKAKKNEEADKVIAQVKLLQEQVKSLEPELERLDKALNFAMNQIGNIVHDSVPISDNEEDNRVEREFKKDGQRKNGDKTLFHHHELLWMIDGYEPNRGASVAGHRGYFLKGPAVALNQALIAYGMQFLAEHGYTSVQTPFFMKKDIMAETAQLSQFDEELYKVTGADEDYYLIATSEQPISALHRGEWFKAEEMPIKYAGISTCFRKEAGAHGKDAWGIFRVHQFEKIEQFVICSPDESWNELERMIGVAEAFYKSLDIPHRVITIVSKELNNAAAKKYDLEAWFPTLETYRELVSCSNCTDYQSRNLNIRLGDAKDKDLGKGFVHMLNATLCATERSMCCLLENYQTPKGIIIPTVLRPYMGGKEFIPFTHEKPTQKGPNGVKNQGPAIKDVPRTAFHGVAAGGSGGGGATSSLAPEKLAALNTRLASRAYVNGFTPSKADVDALAAIANLPHGVVARYPHVDRWFRHVISFNEEERKQFGQASGGDAKSLEEIFKDGHQHQQQHQQQHQHHQENGVAAPKGKASTPAAAAPVHQDGEVVYDLFP